MSLKSIVRELWGMRDNFWKKGLDGKNINGRARSHIAPESYISSSLIIVQQSKWANLPSELLLDIIKRVEATETSWPARRDVVACAAVCRSWREITKEVVRTPEQCGWLTFPLSLKQPGPREFPIQCFIKRERVTSTYRLYLGLTPALSGDISKLLLSARKIRRATSTDFVISFASDDFSRTSNNYAGKLRSNFLGTKFTIYDSQPPSDSSIQSKCRSHRRIHAKQVSPKLPAGNYSMATITYELNVLRTRGPRRMQCNMDSIPLSSIQEGGTAPTPVASSNSFDDHVYPTNRKSVVVSNPNSLNDPIESIYNSESLVLKNKAPRWHEQLQCWCLNFKGRVTVASVKNFQLVAAIEAHHNVPVVEQEKVILQFGKIGKDIFTMDYRYPLSAFQAFAICLSSFDTKPACE